MPSASADYLIPKQTKNRRPEAAIAMITIINGIILLNAKPIINHLSHGRIMCYIVLLNEKNIRRHMTDLLVSGKTS